MIICLMAGLMKKIPLYKMSYYEKSESHIKNNIKFGLYLSN